MNEKRKYQPERLAQVVIAAAIESSPFSLAAKSYLDKIKPRKLAKARATYATTMNDDEIVLMMHDVSFLQNGSKGMLVTDKAVYSSLLGLSIPIARVFSVTPESTSLGEPSGGVRINDMLIYKDKRVGPWEIPTIRKLSVHARACAIGWPPTQDEIAATRLMSQPKFVDIAYNKAREKLPASRITSSLRTAGLPSEAAKKMAQHFEALIGQHSLRKDLLKTVGVGCVLLAISLGILFYVPQDARGEMFMLKVFAPPFMFTFGTIAGLIYRQRDHKKHFCETWIQHCKSLLTKLPVKKKPS